MAAGSTSPRIAAVDPKSTGCRLTAAAPSPSPTRAARSPSSPTTADNSITNISRAITGIRRRPTRSGVSPSMAMVHLRFSCRDGGDPRTAGCWSEAVFTTYAMTATTSVCGIARVRTSRFCPGRARRDIPAYRRTKRPCSMCAPCRDRWSSTSSRTSARWRAPPYDRRA